MLVSQATSTGFPTEMGDDSMEISSEHGHNVGEDDIDIDIDFTAGHTDEDAILEDAASNIEFGEETHTSSAVVQDDLMVDEDEEQYPMDDEDLVLEDGDHGMHPETGTMSFAMGDTSHFHDHHAALNNGPSEETDNMWDQQEEAVEAAADGGDTQVENGDAHPHEEVESLKDEQTQDADVSTNVLPNHESSNPTPQTQSPVVGATAHGSGSPPTSDLNPASGSPVQAPHPASPEESASVSKETNGVSTEVDALSTHSSAPHIVVVYQSMEYTLFPTPDSDDPDSFFLTDQTILEKPIGEFLTALRDIVHEDLNDEDELSLSFEDLGFEIEETSASHHEFTLGQILDLYEHLLRNDGADPSRSLCMVLASRPVCSRRLANLFAGVAEGKGLSQLIIWDEASEGVDELGVGDDAVSGQPSNPESSREEDAIETFADEEHSNPDSSTREAAIADQANDELNKLIAGDFHATPPPEDASNPQHSLLNEAVKSPLERQPSRDKSRDELVQGTGQNEAQNNESNPKFLKQHTPASGEYEEDDLIDYSEEEEEEEGDLEPGPAKQADQNRINNEYEAINRELERHHSISRSVIDEKDPAQQNEDPTSRAGNLTETKNEDELQNEFWPDQVNFGGDGTAPEEFDELGKGHGDLAADDTRVPTGDEKYDKSHNDDDDENEQGSTNPRLPADSGHEHDAVEGIYEDEEEFELLEQGDVEAGAAQGHEYIHQELEEAEEEADARDYLDLNLDTRATENADTANSSVTVTADETSYEDDLLDFDNDDSKRTEESFTLDNVTENGASKENDDEIDYEDDDEDHEQSSIVNQTPIPITNGGPVKRPLIEVDADDAANSRNQEAKRPRS